MPLQIGDVVSIVYRSTWFLQRVLLTHTYRVTGNTSTQSVTQDLQDIADQSAVLADARYLAEYRACLGSGVTIEEVRAQMVSPLRSVYKQAAVGLDGTQSGNSPTGNVAGVITLRTDLAGRSQVANKHVGPPGPGGYLNGSPSAGGAAGLAALADAMSSFYNVDTTDTNQINLHPVIYHSKIGQNSLITSWQVSDRIGTMRRRTLRVGE